MLSSANAAEVLSTDAPGGNQAPGLEQTGQAEGAQPPSWASPSLLQQHGGTNPATLPGDKHRAGCRHRRQAVFTKPLPAAAVEHHPRHRLQLSTVECFVFRSITTLATTATNLIFGSVKDLNAVFEEKHSTYLEFGTMTLKKKGRPPDRWKAPRLSRWIRVMHRVSYPESSNPEQALF